MMYISLPMTKLREELSNIVEHVNPSDWDLSAIDSSLEIDEKLRSYVNQNQHIKSTMDCAGYCFGRSYASTPEIMQGLYNAAEKVDMDSAIYVWYTQNGAPVHVGKLTADNRVKAKWGRGHVVTSDFEAAPSDFGDKVEFSRDIPDAIVDALWPSTYGE